MGEVVEAFHPRAVLMLALTVGTPSCSTVIGVVSLLTGEILVSLDVQTVV